MLVPRVAVWICSVCLVTLGATGACAQDFPVKPIRIVTSEAGGASDVMARLLAQGLSGSLGQQVIVDNRVSVVGVPIVSKSPPDGYTLLVAGSSFLLSPFIRETSYDPVRDFSPITSVASAPNILVVHPSLPVKSVKELIALAKARPGALNYGSAPAGTSTHLAAELFKSMAGVNIVRIPYKGTGPAHNELLGGQVHLMFGSASSVTSYVKSGRLRALAVSSALPTALAPGLPTIAASGVPGYESVSIQGIWAPGKTPAALINRLNQEIVRMLNRTDVKERLLAIGVEAAPASPEQFATTIKSEITRLGKVLKDAGIRGGE